MTYLFMDVWIRAKGRCLHFHRRRCVCRSHISYTQRLHMYTVHAQAHRTYTNIRSDATNLLNYLWWRSRWLINDMLRYWNRHRLLAMLSTSYQSLALPAFESLISVSTVSMAGQIPGKKNFVLAFHYSRNELSNESRVKWINLTNRIQMPSDQSLKTADQNKDKRFPTHSSPRCKRIDAENHFINFDCVSAQGIRGESLTANVKCTRNYWTDNDV